MLGLEVVAVVGLGGLLLVGTVGAALALQGGPYRPTPGDLAGLAELGIVETKGRLQGEIAGFDTEVEPQPGGVRVTARGLPVDLRIEVQGREPVLAGPWEATRPRRDALQHLHGAAQSTGLHAESGQLAFAVPGHLCQAGQLPRVLAALVGLLEVLRAPVAWDEVVRDPREALPLRLKGLVTLREGDGAATVAAELIDDEEPMLRAVAQAVRGQVDPLRAHGRDEAPERVVPLLAFLPPRVRGEVLAHRVTTSLRQAHPFWLDLDGRVAGEEVELDELRALGEGIAAVVAPEKTVLGGARFRGFERSFKPFARAAAAVVPVDRGDEPHPWLALCVDMLEVAEGSDAVALTAALDAMATLDDLPALRRHEEHPGVARVIRGLEERHAGHRGGLALAPVTGGELAVADADALGGDLAEPRVDEPERRT